jgi:hypothetical protein
MNRRSQRSDTIKEPDRLLAAIRAARLEAVRAMAGVRIGSTDYQALCDLTQSLDRMAGVLTGDPEALWTKPAPIRRKG